MRLLITGSRTWTKSGPIQILLAGFHANFSDLHVILGDSPSGADAIARKVCDKLGISHKVHEAQWAAHGDCKCFNLEKNCRAAGPKRNQAMVNDSPNVAYAFRSNGDSRGTDDCVRRCIYAKVPTYTIRENEQFP